MKSRVVFLLCLALAARPAFGAEPGKFKTEKDKRSYAIGLDMGNSLKRNEIDVNPDMVAKGLKDVLSGKKAQLTDEEIRSVLIGLQKDLQTRQQARMKAVSEKNRKEGEAFLDGNRNKEGVKTLPSGLQYKVLVEGKGKTPSETDTVTVNYRGTLIDGTEFDSSYKRGEPATFPVNGVIKGWTEALQLMKEGSKWELFIPSGLAYGERGTPGGVIGPNAVLIFEVELLSVKEK